MLAAPARLRFLIEARPCVLYVFFFAHEAGVNIPIAISTYCSGIIRAKEDLLIRLTSAKGSSSTSCVATTLPRLLIFSLDIDRTLRGPELPPVASEIG